MATYADIVRPSVESKLFEIFVAQWYGRINNEIGPSSRGRKKYVYKLIKTNFITECYCEMMLPQSHRSAFSKFRCGVAPIRIETGRYERLAEDLKICPFCNLVENEIHVLLHCQLHEDLRETLFKKALECVLYFHSMSDEQKFVVLFFSPESVRFFAKTCAWIMQRRQFLNSK